MCPENEPDRRRWPARVPPRLEPHQLDAHGDPHVAYLRVMPDATPELALTRRFRRFDDAAYREEIAALGAARVARDEYRHLIAAGELDVRVSAWELAVDDVFGEGEDPIAVVTVDEIARQFVLAGWAREPEQDPSRT